MPKWEKGKEGGPGRPSLLTPARIEAIATHIRNGNYLRVAAEAAGVSESAVYKWLERGEDPEEQIQDSLYFQLLQAVVAAHADAERVLVQAINKAATGYTKKTTKTREYTNDEGRQCTETTVEEAEVFDWRAAAWMLEARHRDRWAKVIQPAAEGAETEEVKVLILQQEPSTEAPKQIEQPPPASMDEIL